MLANASLCRRLLQMGGTMQGFEPQEVRPLYQSILDNSPNGVDRAVKYVANNFDSLVDRLVEGIYRIEGGWYESNYNF